MVNGLLSSSESWRATRALQGELLGSSWVPFNAFPFLEAAEAPEPFFFKAEACTQTLSWWRADPFLPHPFAVPDSSVLWKGELRSDVLQISKQAPFNLASIYSMISTGQEIKMNEWWLFCLLKKLQNPSFLPCSPLLHSPVKMAAFLKLKGHFIYKNHWKS